MTALCVRQAVRQGVQGSRQVCAGTEGQLLLLLPWLTRRLPLSWLLAKMRQASATQMALLLRGLCSTEAQIRQPRWEKPASREAPQQHIADPRSAAPARRRVPVRSCSRGELPV